MTSMIPPTYKIRQIIPASLKLTKILLRRSVEAQQRRSRHMIPLLAHSLLGNILVNGCDGKN